jgi:radical SAM protein with 4Fe4S-binding SPASM domain
MQNLKKHGIDELHFEVTGACNLECIYCYNYNYRLSDELSLSEIKKLFSECKKYGTKKFTLTGGEPFVRKDIFQIINLLQGEYVAILTNGKWLYDGIEKHGDFLIKYLQNYFPQIKEFKISLDGFQSHDNLRIGSNHKKIIKLIKILKKAGYKVVINTIVLKENQNDLMKLYKLLVRLKVDRWRVDMPFVQGNYVKHNKKYPVANPKEYCRIFAKIIKAHEQSKNKMVFEIFNLYKSEFKPTNTIIWNNKSHPCEYKRELISMKPNGNIIFCPSLVFPMANFRNQGYNLANVFKTEAQHTFYKLKLADIKDCANCRYLKICGSGCRCNSICDFNSWKRKDQSACYTFPFWEQHILPILKPAHKAFFTKLLNTTGTYPTLNKEKR